MKNIEQWRPTKYEFRNKKLRGSRDPKTLSISSRLMADLLGELYQHYLPLYATGKLADLGCGNVPLFEAYKNLITENVCADWPNTTHTNQYLDITCDLNQPLPFPDEQFDTLILSDVLEHIADPGLLWSEMMRILKPQGRIILNIPFLYKIHEAPHDYYRYTEFALQNFAQKNRAQVLELKAIGGLPEVLTDIVAKNLLKIPLVGSFCSRSLQHLCWLFIHTGLGKKISRNTGKAYPLGYFMIVEKRN